MELAIVLPVILFLLFSILEIGFMVKHRAELGQAAREAARLAAVGATPARMNDGVASSLTTIPHADVTHAYTFRPWNDEAQAWGDWAELGAAGAANSAPAGSQIRVRLGYHHPLLVPGLMGPVLNANEDGAVHVAAASAMMRE